MLFMQRTQIYATAAWRAAQPWSPQCAGPDHMWGHLRQPNPCLSLRWLWSGSRLLNGAQYAAATFRLTLVRWQGNPQCSQVVNKRDALKVTNHPPTQRCEQATVKAGTAKCRMQRPLQSISRRGNRLRDSAQSLENCSSN